METGDGKGHPMRNCTWEGSLLSQRTGEALDMGSREERVTNCQGQERNEEQRQLPQANTTPGLLQPPSFCKGWLHLKELGRSKVRHNFTPFCRDYLGLAIAVFTTGFGFFCADICQILQCVTLSKLC